MNSKKFSVVPGNEFYEKIVISNSNIYYVRGNNLGLPSPPLDHGSLFIYMVRTGRRKRVYTPLETNLRYMI